jgi:hypothetical protein
MGYRARHVRGTLVGTFGVILWLLAIGVAAFFATALLIEAT